MSLSGVDSRERRTCLVQVLCHYRLGLGYLGLDHRVKCNNLAKTCSFSAAESRRMDGGDMIIRF